MQRGRVARNVCTLVDSASVCRVEVEPLAAGAPRRILHAATSLRNGARWSVALALGLRQGEPLGLPWDAAGRRTIRVSGPLVESMRQHRTAQLEERLAAADVWEDHGLVFAQPNG